MGRAHFLCCLSARLGVLIFALAQFLSSGCLAALLWFFLIRNQQTHQLQLRKPLLAGLITLGAVSSIIALVSFAGFVGALIKWARGVRAFARLTAWLLGIQLLFSVLCIIAIYIEPKEDFIKQCVHSSTDANVIDTCTNKIQEVRGIIVAIMVVALLLHCYELHVVGAYASELEQKEFNQNITLGNSSKGRYTPIAHVDTSYPYAEPAHGYSYQGGYA